MKKIYLWAALVGVFALGACSEDELPDNNGGNGGQEEPTAEVMVLTYDKFLQSNDVEITSPDTATISVSKAFLEANDIDATVGTTPVPLVVWRSMNTAPFVRNVVKSEVKGDKVELTTTYGDMGDVFPDADFDLDTDLHVNRSQSARRMTRSGRSEVNPDRYIDEEGTYHPAVFIVEEGEDLADETGEVRKTRAEEAQCFTAEDLLEDNADFRILNIDTKVRNISLPVVNEKDAKVNIYAKDNYIKAIAGLKVNVQTKWFKLKKFECITYGDFALKTTVGLDASAKYSKEVNKQLATFGRCTAVFWVGVIPVAVTSEMGLRSTGEFNFNAKCDVSTTIDCWAKYEAGARYEGGWKGVKSGSAGCNKAVNVKTEVELNANAELATMLYANVMLYGCAGPEINLGPKVNAEATAKLMSSVEGNTGKGYLAGNYKVGISVGGSVDAVIKIWKWELARWSQPFTIWNGPSKEDSFRIDF